MRPAGVIHPTLPLSFLILSLLVSQAHRRPHRRKKFQSPLIDTLWVALGVPPFSKKLPADQLCASPLQLHPRCSPTLCAEFSAARPSLRAGLSVHAQGTQMWTDSGGLVILRGQMGAWGCTNESPHQAWEGRGQRALSRAGGHGCRSLPQYWASTSLSPQGCDTLRGSGK